MALALSLWALLCRYRCRLLLAEVPKGTDSNSELKLLGAERNPQKMEVIYHVNDLDAAPPEWRIHDVQDTRSRCRTSTVHNGPALGQGRRHSSHARTSPPVSGPATATQSFRNSGSQLRAWDIHASSLDSCLQAAPLLVVSAALCQRPLLPMVPPNVLARGAQDIADVYVRD